MISARKPTRAPIPVDVRVRPLCSTAAYVAPPPEQKSASAHQHFLSSRKKLRVAVCEFSVLSYGGYSAPASATCKRRKPELQHRQTDSATADAPEAHSASAWPPQHVSALASIAMSTSSAATMRLYCYAFASRAASVKENFKLLPTVTPHPHAALASRATSSDCEIARVQRCKNSWLSAPACALLRRMHLRKYRELRASRRPTR